MKGSIMYLRRYLFFAFIALSLLANQACAQTADTDTQPSQTDSTAVTATVASNHLRFAAPAQVLQLRLELYAATGERVFDSGVHQGNLFDWQTADVAQGLTDGSYLCGDGRARLRFRRAS